MIRSVNGKTPRIADSAFISEAAYIVGDVEIGENSSVWPGAVVRGDLGKITIGRYVVVEDNCVVHSGSPAMPPIGNVTIGDNVIIGHGAVVQCRKIGNNVLVSIKAILLHDAEIGDNSIIAAGCVVKEKMIIPEKSFVVGVPAEIKGEVAGSQSYWRENSPGIYAELARQYKNEGLESG
ncbi:MAG: gamma carbonic anhydrase family protein [Dehalococcoidales bacterium]|nr:gamma carbonic anhydrase family protein [Dehalococcoidales bacterium]